MANTFDVRNQDRVASFGGMVNHMMRTAEVERQGTSSAMESYDNYDPLDSTQSRMQTRQNDYNTDRTGIKDNHAGEIVLKTETPLNDPVNDKSRHSLMHKLADSAAQQQYM